MAKGKQKKNSLTPNEQKTTAAFKLKCEQIKTLEKSLTSTQNELEEYREKYYEADKNQAIEANKNSVSKFHEILKFIVSGVFVGLGVNFITNHSYAYGTELIIAGAICYAVIVFVDKK